MSMFVIQPYILVSKLKKTKKEFLRCTGYLNSIKTYKASSSSCTTTELSKLLTSYLTAAKNMFSSTVKNYMRDSGDILDKFKARDFNATSLSTYDFSTLYTTLPHNLIKDNFFSSY